MSELARNITEGFLEEEGQIFQLYADSGKEAPGPPRSGGRHVQTLMHMYSFNKHLLSAYYTY